MLISWAVIAIAAVGALVALGLWQPIRITVEWTQQQSDTDGRLSVRTLFGLVRLERKLTAIDTFLTEDGPALRFRHQPAAGDGGGNQSTVLTPGEVMHVFRNWDRWSRFVRAVLRDIRWVLHRMHVEELSWRMRIGTGDAPATGMACGAAWALAGTLVGWLASHTRMAAPGDVRIDPDFERKSFQSRFRCIVWVRAGYAILGGIGVARAWRRRQTHGTPHSRSHEDGHGEHSRDGRRQHHHR